MSDGRPTNVQQTSDGRSSDVCPRDVRWTSDGRPSNVRPTSVCMTYPTDVRWTSDGRRTRPGLLSHQRLTLTWTYLQRRFESEGLEDSRCQLPWRPSIIVSTDDGWRDPESFCASLSKMFYFSHRLDAAAHPGSRELRDVKIAASYDAWRLPKPRRHDLDFLF